MPFFYPFKAVFGDQLQVIKADIYPQIYILAQLMRLVMIQFFVLILILIAECRNITQHSRSSREAACTFSIKELLVCKTAFYHYAIIFILYKSKMVILFYKLG